MIPCTTLAWELPAVSVKSCWLNSTHADYHRRLYRYILFLLYFFNLLPVIKTGSTRNFWRAKIQDHYYYQTIIYIYLSCISYFLPPFFFLCICFWNQSGKPRVKSFMFLFWFFFYKYYMLLTSTCGIDRSCPYNKPPFRLPFHCVNSINTNMPDLIPYELPRSHVYGLMATFKCPFSG